MMRIMYWTLASFFLFVAASLAIAVLKPGPTEAQVMRWMSGMMAAMHGSLMGASMDNSEKLGSLLQTSAGWAIKLIVLGTVIGLFLRMRRVNHDKG